MGLIDFIKNVGANLFGKGEDEATTITNLLNTELPNQITNLQVKFDDGVVDLYGQAASQAVKEKAVLLAGNIKGVAKVNDVYLTAPQAPPAEETVYYEVKSGDSLSKIAKAFYGNAMKYPVIFEANREVIKNPDLIYPGQKLRIPKIN
ncbi:MAG TPA: peptidoglycan-binding protein LysM [bacterium]|nr:peptidoglycan-binding protein LysM [bacterium]HQG44934.1 peptidoglycan-binding protein LysM [bacterium]HQI47610.1 peptidoglycan-binding protein LysM [bacterium]HQJ64387.1 peptidoglycan-binding protein LysM [bacterium]HQJ65499.1 peptidoglycan-binding protein LysM [bacterium]